jgi:hypothetical protein
MRGILKILLLLEWAHYFTEKNCFMMEVGVILTIVA